MTTGIGTLFTDSHYVEVVLPCFFLELFFFFQLHSPFYCLIEGKFPEDEVNHFKMSGSVAFSTITVVNALSNQRLCLVPEYFLHLRAFHSELFQPIFLNRILEFCICAINAQTFNCVRLFAH